MKTSRITLSFVKVILAFLFALVGAAPLANAATNLPFGQVTTGTIGSAAQTVKYSFSANTGDVIDFTVAATSGTLNPLIQVFTSNGTTPFAAADNYSTFYGTCESGPVELNSVTLPASPGGTYVVWISDCASTNTGDYAIYTQRRNNPSGAVNLPLDQTITGTIGSAAQTDTYTFSGTANEVLNFDTNNTSGGLNPRFRLYNPDGSLLEEADNYSTFYGVCESAVLEMDTVKLPTTGTYTLFFADCADTNTGNYTLFVQSTNDPVGPITDVVWGEVQPGIVNAASVLVQSNSYTFNGTANDTLDFSVVPTGSFYPRFSIYNPDGSLLGRADDYSTFYGVCESGNVTWNNVKLPTTGTYVALMDACNYTVGGNYTLSSQCFGACLLPAPVISSLSPNAALAGSGGFTLTVNGANFAESNATSVVEWNGTPLSTTWVSTNQMTAAVPASDLKVAVCYPITVTTPTPGGGTSAPIQFCVNNPVPATTSPLSPASGIVGAGTFTLTVNGSNFVSGSSVQWNGSALATNFVSATQLTATANCSATGTVSVTVFNSTPGGGTSNPQTLACNNPVPVTNSLSPSSVGWGGPTFTLTVNGSNFVQSSTVNWNGSGLATTYVSASKLTVSIPAADCAAIGTDQVTVTNPTPGGGTSSPALTFHCVNPKPKTTSPLSPASAIVGSGNFTLTVNGSNFISGSVIWWNGAALATNFVSATQLTATANCTAAAAIPVTVVNATPGGGTSNSQTFTCNNPAPAATSLSPTIVKAGGAGFTLTVNGTNFVSTSTVNWNGGGIPTTYVSATELQAAVPSADISAMGTAQVTVTNSTPGGGTSLPSLPLSVEPASAVLTAPAPGTVLPGPNVTFTWAAAFNATSYTFDLGTTLGGKDLFGSGATTLTSLALSKLPTNGETIYARLYTIVGSVSTHTDYTFTAATRAALISPTPSTVLSGPTVTFTWSAATAGATGYTFDLGTTLGGKDIFGSGAIAATSTTGFALPTNGEPIYARLYTDYGSSFAYTDYVYTAATQSALTSPTPSSVLTGPTITFTWSTATAGATGYIFDLGTTVGAKDLYGTGTVTKTSATVYNLPTNGPILYARMITVYGTKQIYIDYVYTATTQSALTSPTPGAMLAGPTATFNWSAATGATGYILDLGTTVGAKDLFGSGTVTKNSSTVYNLPTDGSTVHARIYTFYGTKQFYTDYTYTAVTRSALTSPTPGSVLAGATVTFNWSTATGGATGYIFDLGTTQGAKDLYGSGTVTKNSATVYHLPTTGQTLYARMITVYGTKQVYTDYVYTAAP